MCGVYSLQVMFECRECHMCNVHSINRYLCSLTVTEYYCVWLTLCELANPHMHPNGTIVH